VLEAAGRQVLPPGAEPVRVPLPPPGPAQFVVVLKERAGGRALPIWIGPHEAQLIKWQLAGGSAPRPLTYELMARLLEAAEAKVEQVTISRLHEQVFYATLTVRTPAGLREVDARPSDALALAQRVNAPIQVDEAVLAQAGVAAEALAAHLEAKTQEWAAGVEPPPQAVKVEWRWVSAPAPDFSPPRPPDQK
jgi:bifunctional DNase/RNase